MSTLFFTETSIDNEDNSVADSLPGIPNESSDKDYSIWDSLLPICAVSLLSSDF
jgi:hypothetical protein